MDKYSLVGHTEHIWDITRYTIGALEKEGLDHLVEEMEYKLIGCEYFETLVICKRYIRKANEAAKKRLKRYKIKYRWHCEECDGNSEDIVEANTLIDAYYIVEDRCLSAHRAYYPYSIVEVTE